MSERPSLDPEITMPYLDTRGMLPEVYDALVHAANAVGRHMKGAPTMSDLRQQIGRTFWTAYNDSKFGGRTEFTSIEYGLDASIAVAEPVIRTQVIEELAQKADEVWGWIEGDSGPQGFAGWIRAQQDATHD